MKQRIVIMTFIGSFSFYNVDFRLKRILPPKKTFQKRNENRKKKRESHVAQAGVEAKQEATE
jgi:hypothetical protein